MNSRERVHAVINHQIPDYVPCGLGGCETAGLHLLAYDKLQNILKVEKKPPRFSSFMCTAAFEQDVLRAMGGDILLIASPLLCKAPLWSINYEKEWKKEQLWGKTFKVPKSDIFEHLDDGTILWKSRGNLKCPPSGYFFDSATPTDLMQSFEFPSPDTYNPPNELSDVFLRDLQETAKMLYNETDFSLLLGETLTDLQIMPGGEIGYMVLMLEEPDIMCEFLQKAVTASLAQLKQIDQAIGKYVDTVSIAHDMGDNRGITIGPELWRKIYKPFYMELFQGWRKTTNMKSNLHTCGSVESILGDLIECGVDIYNPVQTSAANMDAESLKSRFGNQLVFFGGGYDCQQFSNGDSYDVVYKAVSDTVNIFKKNGGYIFAGVHNLPADIPEHHLRAMLDAWEKNKYY